MKLRKTILIIVTIILITLILTFSSFATENSESILDTPDSSIENEQPENSEETNVENDRENNETGNNQDSNTSNDNISNEGSSNNNNVNNSDNTSNQENNSSSDDNYEQIPDQTENNYTPPTIETQKPTYNVVEEKLSENDNLSDLILDIEGLSPEFDKNITEYYLIVDLSIESINIEANPEDNNSSVTIEGNTDLQEGENTITITVKAEAGNTKTYTINVTKTDNVDMVNANLKSLEVKGFSFYPTFKNNIYNYNLMINEKISKLEITAETEIEEATYEIIGNENLVEGDNLVKIIVTAKDGIAKREYKLNIYISSENVEIQEVNRTPAIILLSVLGIAIIGTAIAISKKSN